MMRASYIFVVALVLTLVGAGNAKAATITVTGTGDTVAVDGVVTLREAITSINAGANTNADVVAVGAYGTADTINFNIAGAGTHTILLTGSSLPSIVKRLTINGYSQPGSLANSAVTGDNSTHLIIIDGSGAGVTNCLTLDTGSSNSTIRGLVINNCTNGIGLFVNDGQNDIIAGNFVGTNAAGTTAVANSSGGVVVGNIGTNISGTTVGGSAVADRNVISGNNGQQLFVGVFNGTANNIFIQNNYIGANAAGTAGLGGGLGLKLDTLNSGTIGGASNSLGGSCSGTCNLIAGNGAGGLSIITEGVPPAQVYTIQGNFIGTNVTGTAALSNGTQPGMNLGGSGNTITIGGTAVGVGNLISGQGTTKPGILTAGAFTAVNIQGNFIGTTTTGNAVLGNGGAGIENDSLNVTIGGSTAAARNVIGGNGNGLTPKGPGILLEGLGLGTTLATTVIQGNNIGIGADGASNVGNVGDGIDVVFVSQGSTIGASSSGGAGGNIIAFNGAGRTNGAGVGVANGSQAKILSNSIFSNTGTATGIGIDLTANANPTDGPTANDSCDGDAGGNTLQNFPVLTVANTTGASVLIAGTLNSTASTAFTVEFFSNPSGSQGRTFIGSTTTTTNGSCNAFFSATFVQPVTAGSTITGTATDPSGNTSEFSAAVTAQAVVVTATDSTITGTIVDNSGKPVEGVAVRLSGTQNRLTITDVNGNYHFDNVETDGIYLVTPSRPNFTFGPTQRSFTALGQKVEATFTALPNSQGINPLDTTEYFVRQQYLDFLGREPDEAGLNFWVNNIRSCATDVQCTEVKRIDTSAAFFLSIEFQQTGFLVYRMYDAAYGDIPNTSVPVRVSDFQADTRQISNGLVVLKDGWQTVLENNKQAFALDFVQRSQFAAAFPATMAPSEFVDRLFANAGVKPSNVDRAAAINEFAGAASSDPGARARALRRVAENASLMKQEFNPAFVLMEYFGYLRRDPNSAPDANFAGYDFWLTKLNDFNGNFQKAEMVKAFLMATEYRARFPR